MGDLSRWVLRIEIDLYFKRHTVIFIVLQCESIIQQQKSIGPASVAIKCLFSFCKIALRFGSHCEEHIRVIILPP